MEVTGTPPSSEGISTAPEVALGMAGEEDEPPPSVAPPLETEYVHATPSTVAVSAKAAFAAQSIDAKRERSVVVFIESESLTVGLNGAS